MSSYSRKYNSVENPDQTPVKTGYKFPFLNTFDYEDFLDEADKWEQILEESMGAEVNREGGVRVRIHREYPTARTKDRLNSLLEHGGQALKGEIQYSWENGYGKLEFEDPGTVGSYKIVFEAKINEKTPKTAKFLCLIQENGYKPL